MLYCMTMISLYDILETSNGQLFGEPAAQIFTSFCLDSRQAKESQLFVAMKTDQGDTHQYIEEAIARGVAGVMCTRPPECDTTGVSVILAREVRAGLMSWAHFVLGKLGTKVVGVTGSSGKSVTVDAITQVLSTRYKVHRGDIDHDGPLSVPLSLAKLGADDKFVVLKMGATQPGEMAEMVQAVEPDVGVIVQIGQSHLDRFASLEQIAQEKRILIEYLSPTGLAVLNYDNDAAREMATHTRARVMTVGIDRFGADLMAYGLVIGPNGTGFDLRYGSERHIGRWIPLLGKHQLYGVLCALAVGLNFEVSIDEALKALSTMNPLPGRMNPLPGVNDALLIDDTHSANPQSTLAALDWLEAVKDEGQRVIFVMGDMDNLGAQSQLGHRTIGQRAAAVADVIVTEGTEAALIGRAALDQGMALNTIYTTYSTLDTVAALKDIYRLTSDDIVLVKGGTSTRMELAVQALLKDEADRKLLVRQGITWDTGALVQPGRPSWVEIDTNALATNVRAIKSLVGDNVTLMAVVKANGYGHGAVTVARTALLNGAEYLAVASMSEALELRDAGIGAPILVLGYTPVYAIRQAIRHNITVTLYDLELGQAFNRAARELDRKLTVHIKVDTGMGRLGVMPGDVVTLFRHLTTMKNLEVEGIFTHFSIADEDPEATAEQLTVFKNAIRPVRAAGFSLKYTHAANSAATLTYKDSHFNMVRVGVALYGLHPSPQVQLPAGMNPAMAWKTVVAQVKKLPPGHAVGYGNSYITTTEETIAVLPVGYADGFRRSPKNWCEVLIHGEYAEVIGRVGMEKTMINVTDIPGVTIGDEVVLLGTQGDASITAEDIGHRLDTNNYEVVCTILPRAPRR
jgi:Alr-MurF fusion protein